MRTHYDVLRITITASDADVKRAYHKLALTHHPDKTLHLTDAERADRERVFKLATTANEILSDPLKRAAYDRATRATRPVAQTRHAAQPQYKRPSAKAYTQPTPNPDPSSWWQPRDTQPSPPPSPPHQPPPPPRSTIHPFTSGNPTQPTSNNIPWFYAPVASNPSSTTLKYTSHCGWSFSICLFAKYIFTRRPVLPLLQADTRAEISVEIHLSRDRSASLSDAFGRDCTVNVTHTPGKRQTALSSMFVESKDGSIVLRISLATATEDEPRVLSPLACMYTWAFDMDMGFLAPFYSTARVTCLMFWPYYPAHAVGEGGGAPEREPWPVGSPMAAVKMVCGGVRFVKMSKRFYCEEQTWGTKKFWRLAAVGSV